MPVIGATQLEPIAPVSNFLSGMETARNALAQQQEQKMAQAKFGMEQRRFQREEETAATAAQNALARQQALASGDPRAMFKAGFTKEAGEFADLEYNERKRGLEEVTQQAGSFLSNPAFLTLERVMPWAQSAAQRNHLSPQALEMIAAARTPAELGGVLAQIRDQGVTAAQQLADQRARETAARDEQRISLERRRVDLEGQRVGLEGRRVRVAENEANKPPEAGKPPAGYRVSATGDLEAIPGGPADPAIIKRNADAGRAAPIGSARTSEQERNTAYNTGRLLGSLESITKAVQKKPSASAPGAVEAALLSSPFGLLEPAANWVRSDQRQIVANAQADMIDALLYLATGAAYNKEQLEAQRQAYLPNFTDKDAAREDKRIRLKSLIEAAKVRSGNAWTPELDAKFQAFVTPSAPAPYDGVDSNNPLLK